MSESQKFATPRSHSRPSAGRPTREQAEARNLELLDTALEIFLNRGYEQTTMECVAVAVGMTKRTVYSRHPDKAALFKATVQRAIKGQIVSEATLAKLERNDLEVTLTAVARMRVAQVLTPEGLKLQRIINTESYRFPEIFMMSYEQGAGPIIAFLAGLLRHHHKAETVCVDQPEMAANAFMSMVVGGPVRMSVSGNALSNEAIDALINFNVRLFLNGVRRKSDR